MAVNVAIGGIAPKKLKFLIPKTVCKNHGSIVIPYNDKNQQFLTKEC